MCKITKADFEGTPLTTEEINKRTMSFIRSVEKAHQDAANSTLVFGGDSKVTEKFNPNSLAEALAGIKFPQDLKNAAKVGLESIRVGNTYHFGGGKLTEDELRSLEKECPCVLTDDFANRDSQPKRIFNIDTGDLSPEEAEAYVRKLIQKYRDKRTSEL